MTVKNERMKQHALILSMLPDLVVAVCRTGEMTYVSPACQWLLLHAPEEVTGANIFELVTHDCHPLLRKMISDNLSRPVLPQQQHPAARDPIEFDVSGDEAADHSDGEPAIINREDTPPFRQQLGNHRDRLHKRYRQSQEASSSSSSSLGSGKDGSRGGGVPKPSQAPKMLRLIRCDKTTVWCESRLSVRTSKGDGTVGSVAPLEIILTLRTVSEGSKTSMAHGIAGARVPAFDRPTTTTTTTSTPAPSAAAAADADEYVGADDEGYQCEEEEDSNNSGSGNDSGTTSRAKSGSGSGSSGGEGAGVGVGAGCTNNKRSSSSGGGGGEDDDEAEAKESQASPEPVVVVEGREERSLTKKRQRVSIGNRMENMMSAVARKGDRNGDRGGGNGNSNSGNGDGDGVANKSGEEEDSSTGADTGGSTTHEGSASCSNEADSNGEGSNNGSSKWGDVGCGGDDTGFADRGPGCGDYHGSETGSSDGSSAAGGDLAEEMQNAVQSLILMGGSYGSETAR